MNNIENKFEDIKKEWDIYWSKNKIKPKSRKLYDIGASFYRNYLIGPTLKKIIRNNFNKNDLLLHAGCGGGETDLFIKDYINIHAIDISPNALEKYRELNSDKTKSQLGNIFDLSNIDTKFDGIYNLGVMEHFLEKDILKILNEFEKILKNNGKVILFWPPRFGLSVIALHIIHFLMRFILRDNTKLHAAEPTKIKSKKFIYNLIKKSNFKIEKTMFGINDAFTYFVVILKKN